MRTPPERLPDQQFNNADSYGMAFDAAWQRLSAGTTHGLIDREAVLQRILAELTDHPFALNQPEQVRNVAEFRLRLLRL